MDGQDSRNKYYIKKDARMIDRLTEWIHQKKQEIKYGTITLTITIHQGQVSAIEKEVKEKEKYPLTK